ncbi:MAG: molybdopterin molybdotransferase MoeA [Devosiaceae bacterium]|nr:molybdopterin molybdotransferase MoeA [Devosiaceae bacterium MH13]
MSTLLPLEDALRTMLEAAEPFRVSHEPLLSCDGLILAEDVLARRTQPPFAVSAMDGYAVTGQPDAGARYKVIGEVPAGGAYDGTLAANEAIRIFTGAPIPDSASHVVIQEDVQREGDTITIAESVGSGANTRPAGGDFSAGQTLLKKGHRLTPQDVALAAAGDHATLSVYRRPTVHIIMNGDELAWPRGHEATQTQHEAATRSDRPNTRSGQIVASNGFGVHALVRRFGAEPVELSLVPDEPETLQTLFETSPADVLVTIGGTSVGDYDLVRPALEAAGFSLHFPKVALRPGKPTVFGTQQAGARQRTVLGLPGNPVSALVSAMIFLRPLIARLSGREDPVLPTMDAYAASSVPANGPRAHFMRATGNAEAGYTPVSSQDSSLLRLLSGADALLVRPAHAPALEPGDACQIMELPR